MPVVIIPADMAMILTVGHLSPLTKNAGVQFFHGFAWCVRAGGPLDNY